MTIELNNNVYADGGNDTETTPVVLVHGFPVDHRMWDLSLIHISEPTRPY